MATWQAGRGAKKSFASTLPKRNVSRVFNLKTTSKILVAVIEAIEKY